MEYVIPKEKKHRVIINTDAKNEVDDQFAIVHTILSPSFELHGIIPAHFGDQKSKTSLQDSYDETMLLLSLMGMENKFRVENGAESAMPDEETPIDSSGARLIIEEAMKEDSRPLCIAFLGPLTDMASALLIEPRIAEKDIKVIWIGGRDWPSGGREYNLSNDIYAANVIFKSNLEVWQIPRNVYRMMPVGYAELIEKVYPHGKIGKYLIEQVISFNNQSVSRPSEYRILGDSPAIGVILFADCGKWRWKPAPVFDQNMNYVHSGKYRPIKVYESIDSRFILEDFFAKLRQYCRKYVSHE
ncbi:Inosine-uridine preferring nucleoside hydrolase [Gracilibacillus orientalis]|uniref:Inosine-uridine preferring nucleoside hydrolase n=1 Tax=Gracilibacillus orientalis TaxID=334253 RepID=A0A1I4R834_9BACI|nr:nucleoside hydrolase [Gracilibacillus orientalis]SFM48462.1 Inosine-uridine preferring nucleoside hydrolase [Gracilibacillus orientalis]